MRIVFMGTPQPAAVSLSALIAAGHEIVAVYSQPDRPSGRGKQITASPVKQLAESHKIPVLQPTKLRAPETIDEFKSHRADAAIVVAYGRILPANFLYAFPNGAINVHFSLLPKLRGAAPVNWAIAGGEKTTGVTTMKMDEGLDTGPLLLQRNIEIGETENAIELMTRLAVAGSDLLCETLEKLGEIVPVGQDDSLATYAPVLNKSDGLIKWSDDAGQLYDRIRGFQPFPTSFSHFRGRRVTFWATRPVAEKMTGAEAGKIVAAGESMSVACGNDSVLEILELQPEGKRRMSTRDFVNGMRVAAGEMFVS